MAEMVTPEPAPRPGPQAGPATTAPSAAAGTPEEPVAVLGVDPGRRWTAAVLRQGEHALHGWTLGPVDAAGRPAADAVDNVHDLAAWARYMARILDQVEATMAAHAQATGTRAVLACEVAVPPAGRRIPLADWLVPRQILAGLLAFDAGLVLVAPASHGARRPVRDCYPAELWPAKGHTGGRPPTWGPCEARRGERDHERAAYDIAGAAAVLLATPPAAATAPSPAVSTGPAGTAEGGGPVA